MKKRILQLSSGVIVLLALLLVSGCRCLDYGPAVNDMRRYIDRERTFGQTIKPSLRKYYAEEKKRWPTNCRTERCDDDPAEIAEWESERAIAKSIAAAEETRESGRLMPYILIEQPAGSAISPGITPSDAIKKPAGQSSNPPKLFPEPGY